MKRLKALYSKLSSELLEVRLASLKKDLAENRTENMLYNRATALQQVAVIENILAKRGR